MGFGEDGRVGGHRDDPSCAHAKEATASNTVSPKLTWKLANRAYTPNEKEKATLKRIKGQICDQGLFNPSPQVGGSEEWEREEINACKLAHLAMQTLSQEDESP